MEMSQAIDKIAPAFVKVQEAIQDPEMNAVNSFVKKADGTSYKYADLTTILKTCRAELTKNGIAVLQTTKADENCVFITIETTLMHTSGQWFRGDVTVPLGGKRDAQAVGSCITYGRRYGLAAIMGIAQQEDDDGDTGSKKRDGAGREQNAETRSSGNSQQRQRQTRRQLPVSDEAPAAISEDRLAYLEQMIIDTGTHRPSFLKFCRVDDLKNLPVTKYQKARQALEQKAIDLGQAENLKRPAEDVTEEEQQTEAA